LTSIVKFTRAIRKSGRSAMIAIPPDIMRSLGWEVGDEITISVTQERDVLIQKKG
jgi:antitoxin component of MazEF toxin-antitoxin module